VLAWFAMTATTGTDLQHGERSTAGFDPLRPQEVWLGRPESGHESWACSGSYVPILAVPPVRCETRQRRLIEEPAHRPCYMPGRPCRPVIVCSSHGLRKEWRLEHGSGSDGDAVSVKVGELEFSDGTKIQLGDSDIVLFVGPNNAGKSAALREIESAFFEDSGKVFKNVSLRKSGTAQEA